MIFRTRKVNTFAELEVGDWIMYSAEKSIGNFTEDQWHLKTNPRQITEIIKMSIPDEQGKYESTWEMDTKNYCRKRYPQVVSFELNAKGIYYFGNVKDILLVTEHIQGFYKDEIHFGIEG
jgi:hypothetical protein